jgi:transcriptional regulator with XRE-family HTH domain
MEHAPQEGESSVIVSLSEAAMHMYTAAIDALPFPEDKKFHKRADVVLSGLRKLRSGLTEAAGRSRSTSTVIQELSAVRRRYDDLMTRAAAAPGSSLGQQLYAARVAAKLTAQEVANGSGLPVDLIDDLEAGEIPTEQEAAKVRELIDALGGVPEKDLFHSNHPAEPPEPEQHEEQHHEPEQHESDESHVNGFDEAFAGDNAG